MNIFSMFSGWFGHPIDEESSTLSSAARSGSGSTSEDPGPPPPPPPPPISNPDQNSSGSAFLTSPLPPEDACDDSKGTVNSEVKEAAAEVLGLKKAKQALILESVLLTDFEETMLAEVVNGPRTSLWDIKKLEDAAILKVGTFLNNRGKFLSVLLAMHSAKVTAPAPAVRPEPVPPNDEHAKTATKPGPIAKKRAKEQKQHPGKKLKVVHSTDIATTEEEEDDGEEENEHAATTTEEDDDDDDEHAADYAATDEHATSGDSCLTYVTSLHDATTEEDDDDAAKEEDGKDDEDDEKEN